MRILPISSASSITDWVETLRDHLEIEIPADATLVITNANQADCENAEELQKNDDSTTTIIYLFQCAIEPFTSLLKIQSKEEPQLHISPLTRSYSIQTKSPLLITINNLVLSMKAKATALSMISGDMPNAIEFKPRELLLITDIPEERFKDHSTRQLASVHEALNEKVPKSHYYEIIADDKLHFVNLGPGWPSGIALKSDSKFTLRLLRKEGHVNVDSNPLKISTE